MSPRRILLLAAAAILLAGCGDRNLVLRVDVLSFIDPGSRQQSFGPISPGASTGEIALIDNQEINLLAGLGDATGLESVTLTCDAMALASDGAGEDTVRVYLSDVQTNARTTPPVIEQTMSFSAGQPDTLHAELNGDARVLALFSQKMLHVTITNSYRGPSGGPPLNGSLQLTGLRGEVIAGWKGF